MTPRIVFHVGLAKTGTTSFQRFCHANRRFLRHHGVLYPRRQCGFQRNHSPLVASYIAHRPEDPSVAMRWESRDKAVRSLADEFEASDARIALVSSEHFSIHFDRSEARQLAQDFAAYDPLVVITLRDTHARFLSAYNTHVTAGGELSIEEYAKATLIEGTRYMSTRETVRIWQEAFGIERIRLVDYDAEPDVTAAILRHCGLEAPLPATPRERASLDPGIVGQLRDANAAIRRRQNVPASRSLAAWLQLSGFSILCRRRLARVAVRNRQAAAVSKWSLSPEVLDRLDEIAQDDKRWIGAECGMLLAGSNARDRIVTSANEPAPEERKAKAEALLDRATRGLWAPSRFLVAAWERITGAQAVRADAARGKGAGRTG